MHITAEHTVPGVDVLSLRRNMHELANLFTAILITSGLLKLGGQDPKRLERYSRELLESGERGAALVREARTMLTKSENLLAGGNGLTHVCDTGHAEAQANQPANRERRSRAPKRKALATA